MNMKFLLEKNLWKLIETDKQINYDDLSYDSIDEVKGHGSCYKSCGYANPKIVSVI